MRIGHEESFQRPHPLSLATPRPRGCDSCGGAVHPSHTLQLWLGEQEEQEAPSGRTQGLSVPETHLPGPAAATEAWRILPSVSPGARLQGPRCRPIFPLACLDQSNLVGHGVPHLQGQAGLAASDRRCCPPGISPSPSMHQPLVSHIWTGWCTRSGAPQRRLWSWASRAGTSRSASSSFTGHTLAPVLPAPRPEFQRSHLLLP